MIRFRFPRPWAGWVLSLYLLLGFTLALGLSQGRVQATATPPIAIAQSSPLAQEQQGRSLLNGGQFQAAVEQFATAAADFARQGDRLGQAGSLTYQALALYELGQVLPAQAVLNQALDALDGQPQSQAVEAQARLTQGRIQLARGDAQGALDTWERAAELYRHQGDRLGELGALNNQAIALQSLGLYRRSQQQLEQVTRQLDDLNHPSLQVSALTDLAIAQQVVGNLRDSQQVLHRAIDLAQQEGHPQQSLMFRALADSHRALGEIDAALEAYEQAITRATTPLERITASLEQASLQRQAGFPDAARESLDTIQVQLNALPPSRPGVYARVNFAETASHLWGPAERRDLADLLATAINQARDLDDPRAEALAVGQLAQLYQQQGQPHEAIALTQQALAIARPLGNSSDIIARWQGQLGQLYEHQGQRDLAILAYSNAVTALDELGQDLVAINPEVRLSFQETVEPIYRDLVSLLLQGDPTQAQLRQARETIEALQVAELENFFREACLEARPMQLEAVDAKAAALYPIILSDRLEVIFGLPGEPLRHYSTPLGEGELQQTLNRFRQSLSLSFSRSEQLQLYQQLYDWLIRPAAADLRRAQTETLVFVLDGQLRNLPMAVLHDGDHYLIEDYSVAIAPSLQLLEPQPLDNRRLQAVIAGLSEARGGFTALPGVETELSRIRGTINADVRLNESFTVEATRNALRRADSPVLHLATHGQFSSNAEDTFILTWDGRLNVNELGQLLQRRDEQRFGALELLVLSACQTAMGDDRALLGLAGLAVRSGARSTIATLWAVRDEATADLMAEFYQQLAQPGMSKAKALQQAQLFLLHQSEYQRPFFWAPFILVGNWL
ncbi:MAG: CHAT domain-containing protein [Phormidium sp. GEM2.Bin31]|nr:MAG: CHAT domain-containing protein [Phormidium sp. GEM2.Bin31]